MSEAENIGEKSFTIRRGKVDSLSLYEITDYELDALDKGTPASLFLNLGIFLLTTSTSFLIALLTTSIQSNRTFTVFTVIVTIGFVAGGVLMFLWYRMRQSTAALIQKIKERIPAEELEPVSQTEDG